MSAAFSSRSCSDDERLERLKALRLRYFSPREVANLHHFPQDFGECVYVIWFLQTCIDQNIYVWGPTFDVAISEIISQFLNLILSSGVGILYVEITWLGHSVKDLFDSVSIYCISLQELNFVFNRRLAESLTGEDSWLSPPWMSFLVRIAFI